MQDLYIARQPIFDRDLKLYGYELLYREDNANESTTIIDDNQATSQVIALGVIEIGLERLVGQSHAFINLSHDYLMGNPYLHYPSSNIVLEIPNNIRLNEPIREASKQLFDLGYTLALDDIFPGAHTLELLPFSKIVKVDILNTPAEQLKPLVAELKKHPVKLLALKVEDGSQVKQLIEMGFDYLQGYFFSKPIVMKHNHLSTNQLAVLDLLSKVYDEEIEADELEQIITRDVTLSYHLLRYINSAFFHLSQNVESMHQAIVFLGRNEIRTWATIISMAGNSDKPDELIKLAMVRGKMCEILASKARLSKIEAFFTVGLLSTLDALMDQPMEKILSSLPLNENIQQALLGHTGIMGDALNCNLAFEQARWGDITFGNFSVPELNDFYLEAITWADNALENM
jgi:c-di-GMP-related signal transduction protein